jgi:hypothetical protein
MKTCELCHLVVDLYSDVIETYDGEVLGSVHAQCLAEAERILSGKSRAVSNSPADSARTVTTIPY